MTWLFTWSSTTDRPTEFFLSLGRGQNTWTIPELFTLVESKRIKKMLELAYAKSFQAWMRVRRLISQHSTYPRLFSWSRCEPESAHPILELFNLDESKRAKKKLELALSRSCSTWI
jgi:hypothetical protein